MLNILVVDDSLIIRKKFEEIIENIGHKLIGAASNGVEAIQAYKTLKPDLVTMDITMPDMDGITVVQNIIKEDPEAKIIMVTSHGQEDKVVKSIQAGAVGYILKPINEEKMTQAIGDIFIKYAYEYDDESLDLE